MKNKGRVIIPSGCQAEQHEISAARILARYFGVTVEFIRPRAQKTPDILMDGREWEMKSPTGSGKYNVEHQIQRALRQSGNIVLDGRRSKIDSSRILSKAKKEFQSKNRIKNMIVLTREEEIYYFSR